MCKEGHKLCHCKEFGKMQPTERGEYAKKNNLCFNCLGAGHSATKCRIPLTCRICRKRHHSLLHQAKQEVTLGQTSNSQPVSQSHVSVEEPVEVNMMIASHFTAKSNIALLATAEVIVRSTQGHTTILRALVDQGSQASFISERAAQRLKTTRQSVKGNVVGVGSTSVGIKQVVQLELQSRWDSTFSLEIQAYVMPKQPTTKIPTKTIISNNWPHIDGLNLADPRYHIPGSIDLLLGVREYAQILQQELIKGPPGTPCAQRTNLGWILFGDINTNTQENDVLVLHHQVDVEELLKTLWEIDTDPKRKLTKEERICEEIYEKTYSRREDGRYIVKLPFKTESPKSTEGLTRQTALNRLIQLERRFQRSPQLKKEYIEVIEDYKGLGHIEEVPINEIQTKRTVYLPHHPILREDKETTRIRVVFDASCKGSNGISLNDELLMGPVIQEDLRSIIMRWRLHCFCFASDIQKMYRMILVTKDDRDYQRILWRSDTSQEVKDYRLLTVTFGTTSAPYLAVRTLTQLAFDEGDKYPEAAQILREDFYVDDVLSGGDTVEEVIKISQQLKSLLKSGCFELKKWSSNSVEFMKSIEPNERSSKAHIDLKMDGKIKALGILWNLATDEFCYNFHLPENLSIVTKRTVLSNLQKIYDPLGWIAPSVIMAKMFVQKLWLEGVAWDDKISSILETEWLTLRADFQRINEVSIPRWLHTMKCNKQQIQIHGFCDASSRAYGAAVYCRVVKLDGTIKTALLAARTRVAPLKTVTLPRLELCGAVLLSKLLKQIGLAMRIPSAQIYAWTDSSIVLSWLSGAPNRWKQFVANRVVEITDNVNNSQWHHVLSLDNPADIVSRGMLVTELRQCKLWWEGPKWLSRDKIRFERPNIVPINLEAKETILVNLKIESKQQNELTLTKKITNFNTLNELLTTITLCKRFLNYKKHSDISIPITTNELEDALILCIKIVQREDYEGEIESLRKNKQIKGNSKLKSLNPFLDENNILRVGGRLRLADLAECSKHPIILSNKNSLTPLIIGDAHKRTLHGGVQLMLSYIRSKYWIVRAKGLVKKHIHKCLVCARQSATTRTQIMGDLPQVRVTPSRAFLYSGVDFAGPLQVLTSKGRGAKTHKAYISIFICMVTKAIHLELVGDMTSEAFIGAFRRFVARRGKCIHLYSDQGRNFVGANKELTQAWKEACAEFTGHVAARLVSEGTQWHFIPAYSPNFGGLWEAGVKSIKHHLKRILSTNLTFEEMTTLLCQIEACLNSRPLCPVDESDTDQIEPLTPGHFLIGEAPITIPSPSLKEVKVHYLTRWQHTQKLLHDFWSRWQSEYLSRLQQRPKWLKQRKELERGDIVLIKSDNLPPGKWALGRVTDKHPGPDGVTRVYSVKSGDSVVKRTVTKLCLLPIDSQP
ncbi:unnamed protein product [Parnassius mnemosyne]